MQEVLALSKRKKKNPQPFLDSGISPVAGLTVASFCYLQFFPYPYDADGTSFFFLLLPI